MAYYFGINDGVGSMGTITEAATTTSKDIEVVINTNANVGSKTELVLALTKMIDYITNNPKNW